MTKLEENIQDYIENSLSFLFDNIPNNCTDIVINPNGSVFLYLSNGDIQEQNTKIDLKILKRISIMLASINNINLNNSHPFLSAILPKRKYRLEVLVSPAVNDISISIRIPNNNILSLQTLFDKKMFNKADYKKLKDIITKKKNIIISGETGCGKTTLLTALLNLISPSERLLIIEELTCEINYTNKNTVNIITNNKSFFSSQKAIMSSLRMNPDRIIYGEIRDGISCLEMLKSWRTGHNGGLTTIHAKNISEVKNRIKDLLYETGLNNFDNLINSTVDVIIQLGFDNNTQRIIKEIKFFN